MMVQWKSWLQYHRDVPGSIPGLTEHVMYFLHVTALSKVLTLNCRVEEGGVRIATSHALFVRPFRVNKRVCCLWNPE